jgi:hypothetical protein
VEQHPPPPRTTILRPAASQDRLSQIETRGDSNVVKQAVFELIEPACKTYPGARSRSTHTSIVCTRTGSGRVEPRVFFLIKTARSKQTRTDAS